MMEGEAAGNTPHLAAAFQPAFFLLGEPSLIVCCAELASGLSWQVCRGAWLAWLCCMSCLCKCHGASLSIRPQFGLGAGCVFRHLSQVQQFPQVRT